MMHTPTVLAAFDEQIRRHPGPGGRVERDAAVVRWISGDWTGVTWTELDACSADRAITAQLTRFSGIADKWEWKLYSYDRPVDLLDRLLAAGFAAEPPETLLVADIADLDLAVHVPAGIELLPIVDERGVEQMVRVHDEVFGGDHSAIGRAVLAGLRSEPPTVAAVVAMAGDRPVSSGRLELISGTDFAGIWGGGTLPQWRGRGVFRALVAHRAAIAAAAGYRYLQVDATADSRPILGRLGFTELATTTPLVCSRPPTDAGFSRPAQPALPSVPVPHSAVSAQQPLSLTATPDDVTYGC